MKTKLFLPLIGILGFVLAACGETSVSTSTSTAISTDTSIESVVVTPTVESVALDKQGEELYIGDDATFNAVVTMSDGSAYDGDLVWTIEDTEVATVDDGVVTALSVGSTTLSVEAEGKTAEAAITVKEDVITVFTLNYASYTFNTIGATVTLVPTVSYESGKTYDTEVVWTSDNTDVVTVENGVVTAVGDGIANVKATAGEKSATCKFEVDAQKDADVIIEAERYVNNKAQMYKGNSHAHGGAYVGSIDNCGQGVSFPYFSYTTEERVIEIYYTTGAPGSYHNVYVDGVYKARADYKENTGWGTVEAYNAARTTVTVSLETGWNNIAIIKDGVEADNLSYGGWAELDYFVVKASEQKIDKSIYQENTEYVLEAELGEIRVHEGGKAPFTKPEASLGHFAGNINATGQGVYLDCALPVGTYTLQIVTGSNSASDKIATINTNEQADMNGKIHLATTASYDVFQMASGSVNITFASAENQQIRITREADSDWFTIDYIILTKIA